MIFRFYSSGNAESSTCGGIPVTGLLNSVLGYTLAAKKPSIFRKNLPFSVPPA